MIALLFNTLSFLIPLVVTKNTAESFEYIKIITLYTFTILITATWIINSIKAKKFLFTKTILDRPLIIYLLIYLISAIFSMDPRTSVFGYYSRFNGGFISQFCYALLYWAFVSNMTKKKALKSLNMFLYSTLLASVLAILEHFGIFATCAPIIKSILQSPVNKTELDKYVLLDSFGKIKYLFTTKCFEQDVQNRVFSTFGQPNWLAAAVTTLVPISWYNIIKSDRKTLKNNFLIYNVFWFLVSTIFFVTLLFTKSRSGLLSFGIESILFWLFYFYLEKRKYLKEFLIINFTFLLIFAAVNFGGLKKNPVVINATGPALEAGGTESGIIRKYVWLGAIKVFINHPIIGTGPETFAFSFPLYKSTDHNLTSEWNFIYNKAHNEYLNSLANTGLLGILSYLLLIATSIILIIKKKNIYLLTGYFGILITNFFGFSVVPISLLFFIIPAIAATNDEEIKVKIKKISELDFINQILIVVVTLISLFLINLVRNYYFADIAYAKAKNYNRLKDSKNAISEISKALVISPNEPIYIAELAQADSKVQTATRALNLAPYNQNVRKILISNLLKNVNTNPDNLLNAEKVINDGILISPVDASLYYQLGIIELKLGKDDKALESIKKSVELKPNYKEGRFALGLIYMDLKNYDLAKENLSFILTNIDPNDELTKKYLEEVNSNSSLK